MASLLTHVYNTYFFVAVASAGLVPRLSSEGRNSRSSRNSIDVMDVQFCAGKLAVLLAVEWVEEIAAPALSLALLLCRDETKDHQYSDCS